MASTRPRVIMTSRISGEREKTAYDRVLDWIYETKGKVETAAYGRNKASVREAVREQTLLQQEVLNYGKEVDKMVRLTDDEVQKQGLKDAYDALKDVCERKLNCLNTMLEISTLEEHCSNLGQVFDERAVKLVDPDNRDKSVEPKDDNNQGFLSPSSQDCVFAAEDNWNWLSTLMKCIDTHLKNGAQYQQFFHECDESSVFMLEDLKRLQNSFEISALKGNYQDAERLTQELKDLTTALRQWETKTDYLWEQSRRIVPVHLRTKPIEDPVPARALCNYQTKEHKIRENEDLLVTDTSDRQQWRVRNARGEEFSVPALTVLMPGPFKDATDAAVKMRLQLMAAWTNTLKRAGQRLIFFLLQVFKNSYNEAEIKTLQSIPDVDKVELGRVLDFVEDTLKVHWADHEGFQAMQERILQLRMMLDENADTPADEEAYKSLVVQILILEKLMQRYKDLWREWETYKTALEASRAPELMLIVDKWEQLKYVSRDYFSKFWKNDLNLEDLEKSFQSLKELTLHAGEGSSGSGEQKTIAEAEMFEEGMFEERIEETKTSFEETSAAVADVEGSEFGMATERKTAQTEQLSQAEQEETKRFVIRSVIDPRDDSEVSLDDAIMQGLINPAEGVYKNLKTGEVMPIPNAMTAGLIKVDFTTTRRTQEKKSSFGIITVKTIREVVRPYTIKSVKDLSTGENVSKIEAVKRGVINEPNGLFFDKYGRKKYLLAEAIEKGFIDVEYEGDAPEPEVIAQTYAVRAVVDRAHKKVITFGEAVRRAIIDRDSGAFRDTLTGETMYIGDAIMRGFLKARKIEDATGLDINPENKMVIDKTEKIRQKLLRPLKVLGAFKKAAMLAGNGK